MFILLFLVYSLPPYNCDLSPIEAVLNDVKYAVKKENIDQNIKTVIKTAESIMQNYDKAKWKKHVEHIWKFLLMYFNVS